MPKESAPYFPFYASDYLSDLNVQVMTPEEEGCYLRLMAYAWREKGIPSDPEKLKLLCKGVSPTKLVLDCFDYPSKDKSTLLHPRLELERQKFEEKRKNSAKGGKNSARKRKHKRDLAPQQSTTVLLPSERQVKGNLSFSLSDSLSDSNTPPKSPKGGSGNGHQNTAKFFEIFWEKYPRKEAKQPAYKSFWKINPDSGLLKIMVDWLELAVKSEQWQDRSKIPHPTTWLNQRRWNGDPPPLPRQQELIENQEEDWDG